MAKANTSHVERSNLTIRMGIRRFTRLTNAFSKRLVNHCQMICVYFYFYKLVSAAPGGSEDEAEQPDHAGDGCWLGRSARDARGPGGDGGRGCAASAPAEDLPQARYFRLTQYPQGGPFALGSTPCLHGGRRSRQRSPLLLVDRTDKPERTTGQRHARAVPCGRIIHQPTASPSRAPLNMGARPSSGSTVVPSPGPRTRFYRRGPFTHLRSTTVQPQEPAWGFPA